MNFRLILAVDVLDGVVVHAKRGEREQYRPITLFSTIISSADPIRIVEELKPDEVYIADLNRVMNTGDNRAVLQALRNRDRTLRMMLEYGLRGIEDVKAAVEAEIADNLVLGTETSSMNLIETVSQTDISDDTGISISVSVDLFNKEVLTSDKRLKIEPLLLIKELNEYPVRDVIVLELDRVGTKSGIDFDFLARAVASSDHDILCGGGVRRCEDIYIMEQIGVKGALVATALHDGSIPASALRKDMR
ncbi:MAG: phosphoribosylformimino-5-aminoimidazole carboxamide ribotide isomerase [Methanophagales archaeon]|nr:phosphoribosylformimino-5-aminoimidazole carboxamide ribotide isomerase [Methanophagales archaeon]